MAVSRKEIERRVVFAWARFRILEKKERVEKKSVSLLVLLGFPISSFSMSAFQFSFAFVSVE